MPGKNIDNKYNVSESRDFPPSPSQKLPGWIARYHLHEIATKHDEKIDNYIHTVSFIIDMDNWGQVVFQVFTKSLKCWAKGKKNKLATKKNTMYINVKKHMVKDWTTCTSIKKYIYKIVEMPS